MRADIVSKCFEGGRTHKGRRPKRVKKLDARIDWEEQDEPGERKARYVYTEGGINSRVLKACLKKQVGRQWDDVFSEVISLCKARSYRDYEIRRAMRNWLIEDEVTMIDDVPCRTVYETAMDELYGGGTLYIHPVDGTLCLAGGRRHNYQQNRELTKLPYKGEESFELTSVIKPAFCGCMHFRLGDAKFMVGCNVSDWMYGYSSRDTPLKAVCVHGNNAKVEKLWKVSRPNNRLYAFTQRLFRSLTKDERTILGNKLYSVQLGETA